MTLEKEKPYYVEGANKKLHMWSIKLTDEIEDLVKEQTSTQQVEGAEKTTQRIFSHHKFKYNAIKAYKIFNHV